MASRCLVRAAMVILAWLAPSAALAGSRIVPIGSLPGVYFNSHAYGVSLDGSTVFGNGPSGFADLYLGCLDPLDPSYTACSAAFVWSWEEGMAGIEVPLPPGTNIHYNAKATSSSADGSIIVGMESGSTQTEVFRWSEAGGKVLLGWTADYYRAVLASADASVLAATTRLPSQDAFRWTEVGGQEFLGDLPGGMEQSVVSGITADGSVIVGSSHSAAGWEPYRWTAETGMVGLGHLPGGLSSSATAISADGKVIAGYSFDGSGGQQAFRWTAEMGMEPLGTLPDFDRVEPREISGGGEVIAGFTTSSWQVGGRLPFIWTELTGMRVLRDYLETDLGMDLSDWYLIESVAGISADGRVMVGYGGYRGVPQSWALSIEPAQLPALHPGALVFLSALLLGAAQPALSRRTR